MVLRVCLGCTTCTSLAVLLVRPGLYYLYVLGCTTCTSLAVLLVRPWLYYLDWIGLDNLFSQGKT